MTARHAFTLTEVLVVIGTIAVLASMAVPAIGIARHSLKEMQCGNNLHNIGSAIEIFKQTHDGQFPFNLSSRVYPFGSTNANDRVTSLTSSGEILVGQTATFICPLDASFGEDPWLGRPQNSGSSWTDLTDLHEPHCSYLYEVNGQEIQDQNLLNYFKHGLPDQAAPKNYKTLLDSQPLTWAQAKAIQRRFGNIPADSNIRKFNDIGPSGGIPFPSDKFPIIRCFHHYHWERTGVQDLSKIRKVKAVSWNLNVFDCSPMWECDVDIRFRN